MASELRVNTLKDASGNNSTATSTIFNGTAKAWTFFDGGATTPSHADSFNASTLTDIGTGNQKFAYTSNMSNANFAFGGAAIVDETTFGLLSGSEIAGTHARGANANSISVTIHGDLA